MGFLTDYIKEILGFVIVSGLVVNILPDNKNLKYIKLFTGLVLTLLLISPVLKLGRVDVDSILSSEMGVQVSADKLEEEINNRLDDEYSRISEEYIFGLVSAYGMTAKHIKSDKDSVSVYVSENKGGRDKIDVGRIIINDKSENEGHQELKSLIASKLNILPEQVHIYETG